MKSVVCIVLLLFLDAKEKVVVAICERNMGLGYGKNRNTEGKIIVQGDKRRKATKSERICWYCLACSFLFSRKRKLMFPISERKVGVELCNRSQG